MNSERNDDDNIDSIILVEMVVVFLVLLWRPDFQIMRPRIWSVMMVMMIITSTTQSKRRWWWCSWWW